MSSNTEILIKRSLSTDTPASLLQGELAYSYSSNTLFIGTPSGTASLRIGGYRDFSSNYSSGAGQYGNTTTIPVITVGANGLITAINTAVISTELDITADSGGPSAVNLLTQTLNIAGGDGLTSSVSGQTITLNVDNTLVRANTPLTNQYIDSDVQISGNLTVLGTETIINVDVLKVDDSLLQLAANNTSDIVDIGFIGHYGDGTARHTGLFRHAADKQYYLFSNYTVEPSANTITPFANEFALSTLRANITANTANVLNILTLQSGSQLYANGNAYFANAPIFNSGGTFNNRILLNSGNRITFSNVDNTSNASIYNDGTSGNNSLLIDHGLYVNGNLRVTKKSLAAQSVGTANGGFSFLTDGNQDSGMFSPSDGEVHFYANDTDVAEFTSSTFKIKQATYLTGLANTQTANIIYFDATTGQLSYGRANDINPDEIANGAFRMFISSIDGRVSTNGSGIQLANGAIIKDTSASTLILAPGANYAPGVNDQYIVVDPTLPNHIHLRAGGAIDSSNAILYLGGEETNVLVSDTNKQTYITANNRLWTFQNDGTLNTAGKILTTQSVGTVGGGFSFNGTEGDNDSGMFSPADGEVHFYADSIDVAVFDPATFTIKRPTFLTAINQGATGNLVYFDASTGELTYSSDNALTPTSIANGAFSLSIQSTDGLLVHNGAGIQLANGAIIKDTSGDAVAFGQNAGTITQGTQAVAIGDSAGYNNQGAYGVAVGYGAGNVNQGQTAVAIGINAGISNQGAYGIAIGNSSGSAQGQYGIALGYDSGGSQGNYSIAIGNQAGKGNTSALGVNTIAIGNQAGFESGFANSIILNASGENLVSLASGFYVNPIRYTEAQDANNDGIMFYNSSTKEVRYSYVFDGGSF